MKRQAFTLTIAFLPMLTMCGAHPRGGSASAQETTSTAEVLEQRPFIGSRTDADMSFGDILSWLASGLFRTATANDDHAITDQGPNAQVDPGLDRSANGNSNASDHDPYRVRARFQAPALPSAAARAEHHVNRGR